MIFMAGTFYKCRLFPLSAANFMPHWMEISGKKDHDSIEVFAARYIRNVPVIPILSN